MSPAAARLVFVDLFARLWLCADETTGSQAAWFHGHADELASMQVSAIVAPLFGRSKFPLLGDSANDFPQIPQGPGLSRILTVRRCERPRVLQPSQI